MGALFLVKINKDSSRSGKSPCLLCEELHFQEFEKFVKHQCRPDDRFENAQNDGYKCSGMLEVIDQSADQA